jgi:hypothetical protein
LVGAAGKDFLDTVVNDDSSVDNVLVDRRQRGRCQRRPGRSRPDGVAGDRSRELER